MYSVGCTVQSYRHIYFFFCFLGTALDLMRMVSACYSAFHELYIQPPFACLRDFWFVFFEIKKARALSLIRTILWDSGCVTNLSSRRLYSNAWQSFCRPVSGLDALQLGQNEL